MASSCPPSSTNWPGIASLRSTSPSSSLPAPSSASPSKSRCSLPHLAALRLCRSPHRDHHPAHRRHVQDGPLRLPPHPAAHLRPRRCKLVRTPLLWLAVATIVFSAYAALAQKDLKRIFAYSSINHLGYCLLAHLRPAALHGDAALATEKFAALNGVFLQMFNHAPHRRDPLLVRRHCWSSAAAACAASTTLAACAKSLPSSPD